jgi:hypothetical protein
VGAYHHLADFSCSATLHTNISGEIRRCRGPYGCLDSGESLSIAIVGERGRVRRRCQVIQILIDLAVVPLPLHRIYSGRSEVRTGPEFLAFGG